jgi:hypothetical protein
MEKNNEQIKRENQLFESYILRKNKEDSRSQEEIAAKLRYFKQKPGDAKIKLTPEQKYEIAA